MKYSLMVFLFLLAFAGLSAASAADEIGEGYAVTNFKELSQTTLMLGGLDIKDPKVADEYARLSYCGLYQESFKNDFEWEKIRSQIVTRVLEKREYYRILYETTGVFKLGRYDPASQSFPFSPDTAMVNVGSMVLLSPNFDSGVYCGAKEASDVFLTGMKLLLKQPVTVNKLKLPQDEAEKLLARMRAAENLERRLYGRIRFRVTDASGSAALPGQVRRAELRGDITAVDFFLDSELTKPVAGVAAGGK